MTVAIGVPQGKFIVASRDGMYSVCKADLHPVGQGTGLFQELFRSSLDLTPEAVQLVSTLLQKAIYCFDSGSPGSSKCLALSFFTSK